MDVLISPTEIFDLNQPTTLQSVTNFSVFTIGTSWTSQAAERSPLCMSAAQHGRRADIVGHASERDE